MSRANDPAYPAHGSMGEVVAHGLTIREAFVMAAMQGLIASGSRGGNMFVNGRLHAEMTVGEMAVARADEALAALATHPEAPEYDAQWRERVARSVVSAATGLPYTSDDEVDVHARSTELKQLVLIALEQVKP